MDILALVVGAAALVLGVMNWIRAGEAAKVDDTHTARLDHLRDRVNRMEAEAAAKAADAYRAGLEGGN